MKKQQIYHAFYLFMSFLLFSLFPEEGYSNPGIVQIIPEIERMDLTQYLSVHRDKSGTVKITDIISSTSSQKFSPLEGKSSFGYSTDAFWFKLTAENSSDNPISWFIEYPYAVVDHFEFFHPTESGFKRYVGGDSHHFSKRPVDHRTMVIPIDLPPGIHTFYFKIKSKGSIVAPLTGWGQETFKRHKQLDSALNWLYYGIMLSTAIYCLFVFASAKESIFLFLAVFVFATAMLSMAHTGMALQYFWPESTLWANICHPLFGIIGIWGVLLFTRSFLNTSYHIPGFDKILNGIAWFSIVMGIICFFLPYRVATQTMLLLTGLSGLCMITSGLFLMARGLRQARFYLLAWTPFLVIAILMVLKSFGFLENSLMTDSMVQISTVFLTIILSFGLMDKITAFQRDREKVLGKLHYSEKQFRLLSENVKDIIWIMDLNTMKLVYITPSVKDMMGYTPHEAKQFSLKEILPPESIKKAWRIIQLGTDNGLTEPNEKLNNSIIEMECYNKAKKLFWTETTITVTKDLFGKPIQVIGSTRDISERKQTEKEKKALESQLNQSGKLEAIGTLAGGIAHDMNNILAAILGYTELSIKNIDSKSRMHHRLSRVIKACHRARELVSQILTFSRQDGPDSQKNRIVKIHLIVKEALKLIRATLPSTITIRQDITDKTLKINADPTQVHQIIMNLCSNAGYAMTKKGGILSVSIEKIILDYDMAEKYLNLSPGEYARLTVNDTGQGMEEKFLERIFEPFFTTKPVGEGTGMGLSMVHGIVKKIGGDIFVSSEINKGSTFHVFFPLTVDTLTESPSHKTDIPAGE